MQTSKPISTISYNSEVYLHLLLDSLIDEGIIESYLFVKHYGEFDSVLNKIDKDHIHILIIPNKKLDTLWLKEKFIEVDSNNKCVGCINFVNSVVDEFILYSSHCPAYLLSKGEHKENVYMDFNLWHCSDDDLKNQLISHAFHSSSWARSNCKLDYIKNHSSVESVLNGLCDIKYYTNIRRFIEDYNHFEKSLDFNSVSDSSIPFNKL